MTSWTALRAKLEQCLGTEDLEAVTDLVSDMIEAAQSEASDWFTGHTHPVYALDPDGKDAPRCFEEECEPDVSKPIFNIRWFEDSGDESVGIPGCSGGCLSKDQKGTLVEDRPGAFFELVDESYAGASE
jgi:hypothetical protein